MGGVSSKATLRKTLPVSLVLGCLCAATLVIAAWGSTGTGRAAHDKDPVPDGTAPRMVLALAAGDRCFSLCPFAGCSGPVKNAGSGSCAPASSLSLSALQYEGKDADSRIACLGLGRGLPSAGTYLAHSAKPTFFERLTGFSLMTEPGAIILLFTGMAGFISSFIRRRYHEFRNFLDIVGAALFVSLLLPVVLVAAVLIKLDSPGPVFIRQVRVGINRRRLRYRASEGRDQRARSGYGRLFAIYKLRTMRADAEAKTGPVWAKQNDDRITRIGRFLRKTRLDEIPQFINVLRGEMSIVGPRPERPVFIDQLSRSFRDYTRRLDVKPGITGLAQVRYHYTDSIEDTRVKLKYDLLYVRKYCFLMDAWILLNTFGTVLFARGAR